MRTALSLVLALSCIFVGCTAPVDHTEDKARQKEVLARFDTLDKSIQGLNLKLGAVSTLTYEVRDLNASRPLVGFLTTNYPVAKGEVIHLDDDVYVVESVISFAPGTVSMLDSNKKPTMRSATIV